MLQLAKMKWDVRLAFVSMLSTAVGCVFMQRYIFQSDGFSTCNSSWNIHVCCSLCSEAAFWACFKLSLTLATAPWSNGKEQRVPLTYSLIWWYLAQKACKDLNNPWFIAEVVFPLSLASHFNLFGSIIAVPVQSNRLRFHSFLSEKEKLQESNCQRLFHV